MNYEKTAVILFYNSGFSETSDVFWIFLLTYFYMFILAQVSVHSCLIPRQNTTAQEHGGGRAATSLQSGSKEEKKRRGETFTFPSQVSVTCLFRPDLHLLTVSQLWDLAIQYHSQSPTVSMQGFEGTSRYKPQ